MVTVSFKKGFQKSVKFLNTQQREKLSELVVILAEDPFHSTLHTKSLAGKLAGLFSFRITREWRVMFKFVSPKEVLVIKVRHRKDIYR